MEKTSRQEETIAQKLYFLCYSSFERILTYICNKNRRTISYRNNFAVFPFCPVFLFHRAGNQINVLLITSKRSLVFLSHFDFRR